MFYRCMTLTDWYAEVRYLVLRVYSYFIRGYHGVAPMDTWSLDRHVFRVLAQGMRILAKDPRGYPMWIPEEYNLGTDEHGEAVNTDEAVECWTSWLNDYAEWLEWYLDDNLNITPDSTEAEKVAAINAYDKKYAAFKTVVLPHIMKHIDSMWD